MKHLRELQASLLLQPSKVNDGSANIEQGLFEMWRLQSIRGQVLSDFGQLEAPCVCISPWKSMFSWFLCQ